MYAPPQSWTFAATPDSAAVTQLAHAIRVSPPIAQLLVQRGITTYEAAKYFFRPSLEKLHDPWALQDMQRAVARLQQALTRQACIMLYGDYDVDGTTAVAMVAHALRRLHARVMIYVPDRYKEGYGLSAQGIAEAKAKGVRLLLTLDCGIRAHEMVRDAQQQNIDVIVCDHHNPAPTLPPAYAVINPKRVDCAYPFQGLSGCGVAFKLLQALWHARGLPTADLWEYLDFVAVSTLADVVPLVDENRILTHHGLTKLNSPQVRPGFRALAQAAGLHLGQLTCQDVLFSLAPRINAAGRIAHAQQAVDLLLAPNEMLAQRLASQINAHNQQRRTLDQATTAEALAILQANPKHAAAATTVCFQPHWSKGVLGIVASRCMETHYRPTVILTAISDTHATGSVRGVTGCDVSEALAQCEACLDRYGGHAAAAGLTLPIANIPAFSETFERVVAAAWPSKERQRRQKIDIPLELAQLTWPMYQVLNQMAPFGPGNLSPIFVSEGLVAHRVRVLKDKHLKLTLSQHGGDLWGAIGFDKAALQAIAEAHRPFRMAYGLEANCYQGVARLQLRIHAMQSM